MGFTGFPLLWPKNNFRGLRGNTCQKQPPCAGAQHALYPVEEAALYASSSMISFIDFFKQN